ncbi:MAG: helix-turn-helix domain-containing protein [Mucinivorans sp.]
MGNMQIPKICIRCGMNFKAQKISTKYCSHRCSRLAYKDKQRQAKLIKAQEDIANYGKPPIIREQKKVQTIKLSSDDLTILKSKEFLSTQEASILLGVCKATINNYCARGKLKCIKMNRKIFIRRKDLDEMFETASDYQVTPRVVKPKNKSTIRLTQQTEPDISPPQEAVTEFYSAEEAAQIYGVTKGAIRTRAKSNNVPQITFQGRMLYSKTHIDRLYEKEGVDPAIKEWYSIENVMKAYEMTKSSVYSFVSANAIPRKNEQGKTYYSKTHVNELLKTRLGDDGISEWYTIEDIYDKYGLLPHYIANFVFTNKIPKKRTGGRGYYSKEHFDNAIIEKAPPTIFLTIEDSAICFAKSKEEIHRLVIKHNIPKLKDSKLIRVQKSELNKIINPPKLY